MQTVMKSPILMIGLLFLSLSCQVIAASKSDRAKEKRWEEQIVPSLLVGEPVKLKANGVEFLGLYAENDSDKDLGGVIILHGMGVHPAWPDIIDPLRMALPEHGWHTLSLQMPILPNEVTEEKAYAPLFDEVPGRIQAGVDFLKAKGVTNIVIVGHSIGNVMAVYYMVKNPDPAVKAIAMVAAGPGYAKDPRTDILGNFSKIDVPVLDIYGSEDEQRISDNVKKRTQIARKQGYKNYTPVRVEGANHFFTNMQDVLIQRVSGWLKKNFDK
ncbi:MAG: DUF3530 family protein [Thioalkalispiraceae bacterium]|jgi:pimeloyl-ACP methyl ester carboxylesterase